MESEAISLTAIIGTIGAIITALIKLLETLKSWKENRDDDKRIKKEIDHTLKEIDFINNWLGTVNKACDEESFQERQNTALKRLDHLMATYQQYCQEDKPAPAEPVKSKKGNGWFYAISIFLGLAIMGMFVDDNDNWSLTYFQQNFDSDSLIGLIFFLFIWVYFYINSSFFGSKR